ncbi:uncharacterized protein LOC116205220 isoform X2 [Punica granatum]|nr:uncharacterized protein LOC116205220 isoform X2 [Punica granatum]
MCSERGRRLVHYYMRKASGDSVLSVVGTERSIRHMVYVGTDELLRMFGTHRLIKASRKWRARWEVVDLLNSLVSDSRMEDLADRLPSSEQLASRKLRAGTEETKWSGDNWFCANQLKHYTAFCRSNVTITVHSFVYIMAEVDEEKGHYLGYLEDMYEDKKGLKKVRVRWFHLTQEIVHMFPQFHPCPREVFITPHVQVISAEYVEGPATVLTPAHYKNFLATPLQRAPPEILTCCRRLENNKIRPFSLSWLHGYCDQEVVSLLDPTLGSRSKFRGGNGNSDDGDELSHIDGVLSNGPRVQVLRPVCSESRLKIRKGVAGMKISRCQVWKKSLNKIKVRYEDVMGVDDFVVLEEWVPASRVANPDKLGMRCSGRKTIRPSPPKGVTGDCTFEIGSPVDAWWCNGRWEGVVIGRISVPDKVQVYLPVGSRYWFLSLHEVCEFCLLIHLLGEDRILSLEKRYFRNSRNWVDNRWVEIKPKLDIVSFLYSNGSHRLPLCSNSMEEREELPPLKDVSGPSTPNARVITEDKQESPGETHTIAQMSEEAVLSQ